MHRANTVVRRARRASYVEAILQTLPIVSFDLEVARVYAQIWADLRKKGQNIAAHDLQIGATALHHGLTVLTVNVRDFQAIADLRVQRWPQAQPKEP